MTSAGPADYSLCIDEAEEARLVAQCEDHRPQAEQLMDRIGLPPGAAALDLGCGPLGILDVLAARVGPSGTVVGVEREPRCLTMAARQLRARGLPQVQLVAADAAATGLPADSFDLAHERLVLVNAPRPADILAEMVRLTRPGGYVAVQDFDCSSWTCVPSHPDWARLAALVAAAWSGDLYIGRRLPTLLRQAELIDVEIDTSVRVFGPGHVNHQLLPRFVEIHRDRILAGGTLGPAELDGRLRRVAEHLADPTTFTLHPTLFTVWGRKPE
jgi:SAM-dependent methyltransferase